MNEHHFTIQVRSVVLDEAAVDFVYTSGCDDATVASRQGDTFIHFDREAASLSAAIGSALTDVARGLADAGIDARLVVVVEDAEDGAEPAVSLANAALEAGRLVAVSRPS